MIKCGGITTNYIFRNNFPRDFVRVDPLQGDKDFLGRPLFNIEDFNRYKALNSKIKGITGHSVRNYSGLDKLEEPIKYFIF